MKLKKKSGLISAVIALSCASIVSVGFASWVISQGDSEVINGSISVDTVSDQTHTIVTAKLVSALDVTTDAAKTNVVYGTSSNAASGWLQNTDSNFLENLDFYLYVKVANVNASNTIASVLTVGQLTSTGGGTVDGKTGYAGAAEAHWGNSSNKSLVGALPTPTASATNFTADGEAWFSFSFTWGSLTNNQNPYVYYNALSAETYATEAATALDNLHTLLNGAGYTINVATV